MENNKCSQTNMEKYKSIFQKASTIGVEKELLFDAIQDFRGHFRTVSLENLEEDFMFHMMPSMRKLFLQVYEDNQHIDSEEQIQDLQSNLNITLSLTEFIEDLLNFIDTQLEFAKLNLLKSMFLEIPECIYLTYKHCKESQTKYQNLMKDCKEILLLYKKNQECHMKFLNILTLLVCDTDDWNCSKILITTIQSVSNIIEILLGLNVKALADSWKSYCTIIEKHHEILAAQQFYCVREIELLEFQIQNFMNIALKSNEDKQILQFSKLSGFLLKVALKLIIKFFKHLCLDHLETIYNLVCTIFNYSPDLLRTQMSNTDVEKSVQTCLIDVITSFVGENLLHVEILEQLLNYNSPRKDYGGCLEFNVKILEYINSQTSDSVDFSYFSTAVQLIFSNFSLYFPESYSKEVKELFTNFIEKFTSLLCQCIHAHNSFYNKDFELMMISNILGDHIGRHILASAIRIRILSQLSSHSKKEVVSRWLEMISNCQIDLSFTSSKVILLKNFSHNVFSTLDEEEQIYFLNLYPPLENLPLWRIIGLSYVTSTENSSLNSLLEFISTKFKDMEGTSFEETITLIEALKLFASASNSILQINHETLINIVQTLWESNFEVVPCENEFLKYFISCLTGATMKLMDYLTNDQIVSILKRMEKFVRNNFFKIKICMILDEISNRRTGHNMEQNKLNFVISDLFEVLLKDKDNIVQELSLKIFQQFARNNQYIIVNNVSRMLPDMNLEQYLRNNSDKVDLHYHFERIDLKSSEHKCLVKSGKVIPSRSSSGWPNKNLGLQKKSFDSSSEESLSRGRSFETRNERTVEIKRSTTIRSTMGSSHCKRMKLSEDAEEDDTISDVLQRIKSEIKCLHKILVQQKPSSKNVQDIKMLACQIQNLLET